MSLRLQLLPIRFFILRQASILQRLPEVLKSQFPVEVLSRISNGCVSHLTSGVLFFNENTDGQQKTAQLDTLKEKEEHNRS